MTTPRVVVWESRAVPGVDRLSDTQDVLKYPVVDLKEALLETYDTDVHLSALVVDGEDDLPRFKKGILRELREAGAEPYLGAIFIDVDLPGHKPWSSTKSAQETVEALLDLPVLEKAAVYVTRAGWRAVFAVDPIPAGKYAGLMGSPDEGGLLAWFAEGLPASAGEVDASCSSPLRCYRAPRVMRDGVPTDPPVLDLDGLDAGPLDVSEWLEEAASAPESAAPVTQDLVRPRSIEPLSAARWASAGLEGQLRRRYPGTKDIPGLAPAIRNRQAFFGPGERNNAVFDAAALLAELVYERDTSAEAPEAQEAASFIWSSLAPCVQDAIHSGTSATDEEEALSELWSMIERRIAVEEGKLADHVERAEKAAEARQRVAESRTEVKDEVEAEAAEGDEKPEMLAPIVVWGNNYLILDARDPDSPTYFPATSNQNLLPATLLRGCGSADPWSDNEGPLGLSLRDHKGNFRTMKSLVIDYGAQVQDVITAHGTKKPVLDTERFRLQLPGVVAMDVRPEYDEQVATWLELMGGDDHEALLDWLATLTQLDKPTCALYLQGDPGAGKGLFAACVSSVFGAGFVTFTEAVTKFNDGLRKSPVVFLDEKATSRDNVDISAAFRSLVAETEHRVEAKGQPVGTLRGACRVIIAANNADALPMKGQHSEADIAAVASRIRWIGCDPGASEYLVEIGGRPVTSKWVGPEGAPGSFARHVRWLELNRAVETGPRFLVEGKLREYHELLALTSKRLEVLFAVVAGVLQGRSHVAAVSVLPGAPYRVGVNVKELRQQWNPLTKDYKAPSQGDISGALSALAGVHRKRGAGAQRDRNIYVVPERYLILAADRLGLPSWKVKETLRKIADNASE
jgi:hypothetical protein